MTGAPIGMSTQQELNEAYSEACCALQGVVSFYRTYPGDIPAERALTQIFAASEKAAIALDEMMAWVRPQPPPDLDHCVDHRRAFAQEAE